jgi:hypothetical protein
VSGGRAIAAKHASPSEETVAFASEVIDDSGVAERLEALIARRRGRKRELRVKALLVALFVLVLDDRPLHLKAATRLLFSLSSKWRHDLGLRGDATTKKRFLARYRQVRYLFHLLVSVMDPSVEVKNKVTCAERHQAMRKRLSEAEIEHRRKLLESIVSDLVEASVKVCSDDELSGFDGSVGLDGTPVPLYSRGPSVRAGTSASDPDGGWYVREGDHRDHEGPAKKRLRKVFWALEATILTMGRPPAAAPSFPNLVLGISLGRPGEDPGGSAVRLLSQVRARGFPARFLGADRGYTQGLEERFHMPVRALGYSLVMDYREDQLGRQANSQGALLVEGAFYCPAIPEVLVSASADLRAGLIDDQLHAARIAARASWRLVRKQGPDKDGYERYGCPARGEHPQLCCPLRPSSATKALGNIPVLCPPAEPPKLCIQSAITIAPDVGARHRQDLAFGTEAWARTYATYRNTIEGTNGYLKDTAHESLAAPARRRVRGIAAQSLFCALLVMAANVRKIAAFRELVADGAQEAVARRARRRRMSLADYHPPPPAVA